jgi:catechol 2,3-dioxygenase-like lactoylglutathione lyase family enzyme
VITGLDHVQVAAPPDAEEDARRFYGVLLGLTELPKPPGLADSGGAWFACGAQQLHVGVQEAFIASRKAHPALAVADVASLETLAERLTTSGSPVRWDDRFEGVRRFYTEDPWGNRIELCVAAG